MESSSQNGKLNFLSCKSELTEEVPEVTTANPMAERLKQGAGKTSSSVLKVIRLFKFNIPRQSAKF